WRTERRRIRSSEPKTRHRRWRARSSALYERRMSVMRLDQGTLLSDGLPLLEGLSPDVALELVKSGIDGAFLRLQAAEAKQRLRVRLGRVPSARRFVACHRYEPFWMKPRAGSDPADIPQE